jgi:hypothetical protein
LYGAETWTLRKLDQKYLESFEMWCWRRMEKISWTDRVNNKAVLHRVKEEWNFLCTMRRRRANWIEYILRRNCLLSHFFEGKIIVTRRQGRRCKQLLDYLREARRWWKLKEEAQDRTLWRICRKTDYYLILSVIQQTEWNRKRRFFLNGKNELLCRYE